MKYFDNKLLLWFRMNKTFKNDHTIFLVILKYKISFLKKCIHNVFYILYIYLKLLVNIDLICINNITGI